MKKIILYLSIFSLAVLTGCSKFLDATPKGKILPKTVADYALFLNDLTLADAGYVYCEFMTDDIAYSDESLQTTQDFRTTKSYFWKKDLMKITEDDPEWNGMYAHIFVTNLVLSRIGDATEGTAADKEKVAADAMILRAYYYFNLVSLFGKAYDPASAATDLAVPLLLDPDLEAKTSRATVKEVYDQVLSDLNKAIATTSLPDKGEDYVHPGRAGAYALLARVYLFMNNYDQAAKAAEKALTYNQTLLNYNSFSFVNPARPYSGVNNKPVSTLNPEDIFPRSNSQSGIFTRFMINPDLLNILGDKDLRYVYNFTKLTRTGKPTESPYPDYFASEPNYSIGVPEMMLIQAEVLARSGKVQEPIELLNKIRKNRFTPADYTPLTAGSAEDALKLVLRERRLELFYHGLRWLDLKRLNQDPRFKKDLSRSYDGTTYSLPAGSPNYLLQIAPKIISINPLITQNPRE